MRAEKALLGLLTDRDSLDVLVREGFSIEIMPTEELGAVVQWAMTYISTSGKAPTVMALTERFGDLLSDLEVDVSEIPEESIEWAMEQLTFTYIKKNSADITRSMARHVATSTPETISDVLEEEAASLAALVDDVATATSRMDSVPGRMLDVDGLLALSTPQPLLPKVLDQGQVGLLYGPSGSGKSFLALDLALRLATGQPWAGRPVQPGRVLYLAGEGSAGLAKRLRAWCKHYGTTVPNDMFTVLNLALPLATSPNRREDPKKALDRATLSRFVADGGYSLIVVDTVARYAQGLEENSNSEMGAFVEAATRLVDRMATTGGSVLLVHHSGKNGTGERGASSLLAGVDMAHEMRTDTDRAALGSVRTLTRVKAKDYETAWRYSFRLEQIALDEHRANADDGERLTSAVVVECDGLAKGSRRRDDRVRLVLDYLAMHGPSPTSEIKREVGIRGQDWSSVRRALEASGEVALEKTLTKEGKPYQDGRGLWHLTRAAEASRVAR